MNVRMFSRAYASSYVRIQDVFTTKTTKPFTNVESDCTASGPSFPLTQVSHRKVGRLREYECIVCFLFVVDKLPSNRRLGRWETTFFVFVVSYLLFSCFFFDMYSFKIQHMATSSYSLHNVNGVILEESAFHFILPFHLMFH
jgi:hypothetical protein